MNIRKKLYLNLFKHYKKAVTRLHELNYLFWECTLRCNLNCRHCGSDCRMDPGLKDMNRQDFINVLDQIAPRIIPAKTIIVLTGGEPLLRHDIDACGHAFYQRGFPWGMVTNGYQLTDEKLRMLLRNGLRSLTISLDGLAQNHNWLRGNNDSFTGAFKAVCLAARIPHLMFDVVTCIHQKNFNELADIKNLLINNGVKHWRIFTIFPKGRAINHQLLNLSSGQFTGLMDFIKSTRQEGIINASYGCEGFLGAYETEVRDSPFFCRAGISIGSVLADGSISACPSLRNDYIQGNIYNDKFMDVWNNRFQIMRNRKWTKTGSCQTCSEYKWCLGNGLHLREEKTGRLLFCHHKLIK